MREICGSEPGFGPHEELVSFVNICDGWSHGLKSVREHTYLTAKQEGSRIGPSFDIDGRLRHAGIKIYIVVVGGQFCVKHVLRHLECGNLRIFGPRIDEAYLPPESTSHLNLERTDVIKF